MASIKVFKLNSENDIDISTGNLVVLEDGQAVAQMIGTAWRTVLGEWFLNTESGLDYFGKILVRQPNENIIKQELKRVTLDVPYVTAIFFDSFQLVRITSGYNIVLECTVNTEFGDIKLNDTLGLGV